MSRVREFERSAKAPAPAAGYARADPLGRGTTLATILVTAGPTREHLDDVRFLSNASSGRMGYAIAAAAVDAGHRSVLVSGPTELSAPPGVDFVPVVSASEMHEAVQRQVRTADIVVGVAAVADYRPAERVQGKPPKRDGPWSLELVRNPDVIGEAAAAPGRRAVIGFALEVAEQADGRDALERGRRKLGRKGLDLIAVNLAHAVGAEDSEVVLVFADGRPDEHLPRQKKTETAARLVAAGLELWRQKQ